MLVCGILNVTPDSFSDGGQYYQSNQHQSNQHPLESITLAVQKAEEMVRDGVDIIDIGGESTRPGSTPVPPHVEQQRVIPVIQAIRKSPVAREVSYIHIITCIHTYMHIYMLLPYTYMLLPYTYIIVCLIAFTHTMFSRSFISIILLTYLLTCLPNPFTDLPTTSYPATACSCLLLLLCYCYCYCLLLLPATTAAVVAAVVGVDTNLCRHEEC